MIVDDLDYGKEIFEDFSSLGIREGDHLLVHSSLNSVGRFENRAEIIVEVLRNIIGDSGTLLTPSLSYEYVTKEIPVFNVKETPSCVGGLTEFFRKQKYTRRSIHPTHSVCGVGKNTDNILGDHYKDNTPCGKYSPFRKLKEIGGKILFLGCGTNPNTSMHGIEELVIPPYLFDKEIDYSIVLEDGSSANKRYIPHNFEGYRQRYNRLVDILNHSDYSVGKILTAECYLIKAEPMWSKAFQILKNEPLFFVDKM